MLTMLQGNSLVQNEDKTSGDWLIKQIYMLNTQQGMNSGLVAFASGMCRNLTVETTVI